MNHITNRVAIRVAHPSNLKFPVYGSMWGRGGQEGEGGAFFSSKGTSPCDFHSG